MPIAGRDPGHVVRLLAGRKKGEYVDRRDLALWLTYQTFPPGTAAMAPIDLRTWWQAMEQRTWSEATCVLEAADSEWKANTPASVLAAVAGSMNRVSPEETDEALAVLWKRVTVDKSVHEVSAALMGMARVAMDDHHYAALADVVDYACRYTVHLARLAVARHSMEASASQEDQFFSPSRERQQPPGKFVSTPDEFSPILSVLDSLVYSPSALERALSQQIWQLFCTISSLCRPQGSEVPYDDPESTADYLEWALPRLGLLDQNRILRAALVTLKRETSRQSKYNVARMVAGHEKPLSGTLQLALKVFSRSGFEHASHLIADRLAELRPTRSRSKGSATELDESPLNSIEMSKIAGSEEMDDETKTDRLLQLLLPKFKVHYDFDARSDTSAQLSVLALQALSRRNFHRPAVVLWRRYLQSGEPVQTAALNVAMLAMTSLGHYAEAARTFERLAPPTALPKRATGPDRERHVYDNKLRPVADADTLAHYMDALDHEHRYAAIWPLYTSLWTTWRVAPDETHLELLVRSARRLTAFASTNLHGPVLGAHRHERGKEEVGRYDGGQWDGKSACERAIDVFWATLYLHRPNIASQIAPSLGPLARPNSWLNRIKGASVPPVPKAIADPSVDVLPVMRYGDRRLDKSASFTPRAILPTPESFKELIELLGMAGLGHEVPVALAWMKALKIERPRKRLLEAAYLWFSHSSPRLSEIKALNEFVAGWVGRDQIPTDEALAVLVSRRAHEYRFGGEAD